MKCIINGCEGTKYCKNMCTKHYQRQLDGKEIEKSTRYDPRWHIDCGDFIKIPLGIDAKDGYSIVDRGFERIDKYQRIVDKGYASRRAKWGPRKIHQIVMGETPKGMNIDHINRDRLDNRRENLRFVTMKENIINSGPQANNKTGCSGVTYRKDLGKYRAIIYVDRSPISLGCYTNLSDAIDARVKKEKELGRYINTHLYSDFTI